MTDLQVKLSWLRVSVSISFNMNQATTESPIRIGKMILTGFNLLTSSSWLFWVINHLLITSKDEIILFNSVILDIGF
jgi:hypothetical protein